MLLCAIVFAGMQGCVSQPPKHEVLPTHDEITEESLGLASHLAATAAETPSMTGSNGVRVRLAFSAGADLDLYVTDPTFETVYFANSPNRAGGRLEADLRCDAPSPRVETIRFPTTLSGAYRVGVDFPARCPDGAARATFVVHIEGEQIDALRHGTIDAGHFLPIVLEVYSGRANAIK